MKMISVKEVQEKIGASHAWIYKQIKLGNFPAPHKLGPQMSRWDESEVDTWLSSRPRLNSPEAKTA